MSEQGQIKAKRDAAARARRLARGVTQEDIYRRMVAFADALDGEAIALERIGEIPAASQISRTAVASYPFTAKRSSAVLKMRSAEVPGRESATLFMKW